MNGTDMRPATAVLVAAVLADVPLIAMGLAPETAVLRTRAGKVFTFALVGHVLDILGPADPFRLLRWGAGKLADWSARGARIP